MRAERDADVDQRLVVGLGRRLDRRVVGDDRAEAEQRGDGRQQHAQQVRPEAARRHGYGSLNSSSM
jgi:hypothetical protein